MMMALQLLRPLVETKAWDYCIVWQFGDDPNRYIKWAGCCCIGSCSQGVCRNVKEEIDATEQHCPQLCRDTSVKHGLYTKACAKLAEIPFYLPLYSGIHGEVAMSAQPSWTHDGDGTYVLIPVNGGLIELYGFKHLSRDQEMMETLMAQFNIFCQHMVQPKTEVSPNGSYLWSENSSLVSAGSTKVSPTQSIDKPKTKQKTRNEQYQSKNLETERNRRNRIKNGLFALRALVPKISKMDRAAIVGDAIEYIKELKTNIEELEYELKKFEDDDSKYNGDEVKVCKSKRARELSPKKEHSNVSVQVEVHQIGAKDFLIRITYGQKRGGFRKIMEIIDSLGLLVFDVNVTTCHDRVLNVLKVEAKEKGVSAKGLKEALVNSCIDV
ncbi:transcription factor bHLH90-like [Rutidosis leptorrhynchoides]|uniref:transcription factor bHLH90-like n=1 Tax=Rutidosis leptorrhynchoides TaxID=125765 RepID=UPI003A9A1C9F